MQAKQPAPLAVGADHGYRSAVGSMAVDQSTDGTIEESLLFPAHGQKQPTHSSNMPTATTMNSESSMLVATAARILACRATYPAVVLMCLAIIPTQWLSTGLLAPENPLLLRIGKAISAVSASLLVMLPRDFSRVTKTSGELDKLGAAHIAIPSEKRKCFAVWVRVCTVSCVVATLGAMAISITGAQTAINNRDAMLASNRLLGALLYGVLIPLAVAWYLTLKQAAILVSVSTYKILEAVNRCTPASAAWDSDVVAPILKLIKDTLPTLSDGWQQGSASVCLCCWALGLGTLCQGLSTLGDPEAFCLQQGVAEGSFFCSIEYGIISAAMLLCLPLLVLYDLANTSSDCIGLVKALNDKRIADPKDINHLAIHKLEVMIDQHNHKQGLGFTVASIVLSKAYFATFLTRVGALASASLGTVLAFASQQPLTPCTPTENQVAILANVFTDPSCSYNMTIDSLIRP